MISRGMRPLVGMTMKSGLWVPSVDYVGGGHPSYAVVRTNVRFERERALFCDEIVFDYRADDEAICFDRAVTFVESGVHVFFENEAAALRGHRVSETAIAILDATRRNGDGDAFLMRFDGFVFESA